MQNIDILKKNVSGVERSFLVKDGEIIECDFEEEKLHFLSKSILFMLETFVELDKNLTKISIAADNYCMIFFHDTYILGVVTSKNTNFPLLDMVSNKLLLTIDLTPEETEEIIDRDLKKTLEFMK